MDRRGSERFFRLCRYLLGLSLFGLCAAMLFSKLPRVNALETDTTYATPATRLEDWRFNPEALQLEIVLSSATQPKYFFLSQPSRIVVDLPGTKLGYVPTQQNYSGAVQSIRVSQFNADITRIVLDLAPGAFLDQIQMQLEPISWQNPTRWVLRPSMTSHSTYYPPTNITPPIPNDLQPGIYPPQPPNYSPSGLYSPQPGDRFPSGIYPPQPSGDLPPGVYPPRPRERFPSGNPIPNTYDTPPASTFNNNPEFQTLPSTTNNSQQVPFIRVPPINNNNISPYSSTLPPANFPSPRDNYNNNIPSSERTNFPVPRLPNYPPSSSDSGVIDFGQPIPSP
jgi:AMIN domain